MVVVVVVVDVAVVCVSVANPYSYSLIKLDHSPWSRILKHRQMTQ